MTMPDLTGLHTLKWMRGLAASPNKITSSIDLGKLGFRISNPYDLFFRYAAVQQPLSNGEKPISDGFMSGDDIVLTSQFFEGDSDSLYQDNVKPMIAQLLKGSDAGQKNVFKYLEVGLFDGATVQLYRRYVDFVDFRATMMMKSQMSGADVSLHFRAVDPFIYNDAVVTDFDNAVAGSATVTIPIQPGEGDRRHKRIIYVITRDAGANVTDPTVTDAITGFNFSITGTLTLANEFWHVDTYSGRLRRGTGALIAATDEIDKFSGRFIQREPDAAMLLTSAATGGIYRFQVDSLDTAY